jgi:hypothetical protein
MVAQIAALDHPGALRVSGRGDLDGGDEIMSRGILQQESARP